MEVTIRQYIPLKHQKFLPLRYNTNKSTLLMDGRENTVYYEDPTGLMIIHTDLL